MKVITDAAVIKRELEGYTQDVAENVVKTDFETLSEIADTLIKAKYANKTIFTAGNGEGFI